MSDIVERLRGNDPVAPLRLFREQHVTIQTNVLLDAAAEIERLREQVRYEQERNANNVALADAEIERLRGLLDECAVLLDLDLEEGDNACGRLAKRVREALGGRP